MLPKQLYTRLIHAVFGSLFVLNVVADQFGNDYPVRYLSGGSSPLAKGGWRPIVTSDTITAHFSNILGGQTLGQKILTGPALIETKVISPHIVNLGAYGNEILGNSFSSTSIRPLVTRDVNKLTTLAQAYKSSLYPQSSISLNAPVNTYMNPFSIPTGPGGSFKMNPYQYENTIYIKHQQPMMTHRPAYNKHQSQMMHGKRLKQNQMQAHMLQQLSTNSYHQSFQPNYQNTIKKPIEQYQRPIESFKKPVENFSKPHYQNNYQKPVNPHDSLYTQTKTKHQSNQNIAAVTYKPAFNHHFQQFGIKEEPFGPIPSSILGSFSSFGHASVKAREPTQVRTNRTVQTTTPLTTTEAFSPVSPTNTVKSHPQEHKNNGSIKNNNIRNVHDDYTRNLVPPPHTSTFPDNKSKDSKHKMKGNFIPSPPDPLNKNLNAPEILKPLASKEKQPAKTTYNTNLSTKRPEISSFFEASGPVSTINPFEAQSTKIPEGLMVQMPPPYPGKYNSVKENYQIHHAKPPVKYNIFDDHKYFPSTRGQDLFGIKNVRNQETSTKLPYKGYEVTETWGSSGETNTQPTLHTWINPAQSYKHYNTGLRPPPAINVNVIPNHENRIIPISFSPPPPPRGPEGAIAYTTIPSAYSTIQSNEDHRDFFTELENSLSSLTESQKIQPTGDEVYDLAAPINVTSFTQEEAPVSSTTPSYEEVTTHRSSSRRKPNRNRPIYETSTVSVVTEDLKEYTTKYEEVKEEEIENDNDLQINDLPTLPPNKYFKRPVTTTPTPSTTVSIESWEEKLRKRNKNRRRRPLRVQSTTEEVVQETSTYTDHPIRSYKYRTTTMPSEVEGVTKTVRPRVRFPYRSRLTTKPTSQPELTSSAQPTIVPTSPVTSKPKLHSRIRLTTSPPFDLDDLSETTTLKSTRFYENNDKQSSIMKIAKDNHSNRLPPIKMRPYENSNNKPDYTHKQDEKDTPTSDIAVSTYDHKYSAQKLKDDLLDSAKELSELSDVIVEHTSQAYFLDNLSENNAQLLTEQKLGNRGSIKQDQYGTEESHETLEPIEESETITTTPSTKRIKIKPGKYDTNRPRFSVKDYRNRLNQLSTSTDKPNLSSESPINNKLRFPNRSRFPSFKDQQLDNKPLGSDVSTSSELPRKKFTPKDPRHKSNDENLDNVEKEESIPDIKVVQNEQENEIVTKTVSKVRGSLRRDPNRTRPTTTTTTVEPLSDVSEKTPQKPTNVYTNVKRPVLRKRVQIKNVTVTEMSVSNETETVSTSTETVTMIEEKVESSTEKHTSETAIMKIAKDDRKTPKIEDQPDSSSSEISQRVSDLTLASGKEYNTPGLFKSVSPNTRRVPNYFTIATDDPILPIEAFFPQLNQKKES